jgi:NAD(P)-dependent dehydrogenase (short-subunit alcohol dehydrogenase family)
MTEKLLARGDTVAATARKADFLDDLKPAFGDRLWTACLDVTDTSAITDVMQNAFAAFERIDVIVSNAGYGLFGAAEELASEQIRRQIDTNLLGSIEVIRAAIPHLRAQGGGRILQVSSEGGQYAYPGYGLYHATKFGIEGFVDAVAEETAPFGIRFTLAEPGPTRTNFGNSRVSAAPMSAYEETPVGELRTRMTAGRFSAKMGDPDKVTQAMIDAMDRETPPRRITLGSTAYEHIETALADKLAALRAQKELAYSVDAE